jgi:hypothetical protein
LDCGGKRSATPLWKQVNAPVFFKKALSPLRFASAVQKLPPIFQRRLIPNNPCGRGASRIR